MNGINRHRNKGTIFNFQVVILSCLGALPLYSKTRRVHTQHFVNELLDVRSVINQVVIDFSLDYELKIFTLIYNK